MNDLRKERSAHLTSGTPAMSGGEVQQLLGAVPAWRLGSDGISIEREFRFQNFHQTIGFVNAIAWIANQQDHHPDLEVHYSRCTVRYTTHAVGGLSRNDFIGAARVDGLLE